MKIRLAVGAMLLALLAGCAGAPSNSENAALQDAVRSVAAAADNQSVNKYAPVDLEKAKDTLNQAEMTWRETGDETRTNHLAYLAKRRAQIAEAVGQKGEALAQAKQAEKQRQQLQLESRESEIQELKRKLSSLKPRQTDQGIVLTIGNVLFAFDSAQLNPAAQQPLDTLASFLQAHPEDRVRVEGYTDSVGSDAYNQRLSEERAQAVADAMTQRGISRARMTVVGYGKANPVASNSTASGRQQNRRVEFVILNVNGQQQQGSGTTSQSGGSSSVVMPSGNQDLPTATVPSGSGS